MTVLICGANGSIGSYIAKEEERYENAPSDIDKIHSLLPASPLSALQHHRNSPPFHPCAMSHHKSGDTSLFSTINSFGGVLSLHRTISISSRALQCLMTPMIPLDSLTIRRIYNLKHPLFNSC